jgi:hypothetical protein
LVGGRVGRGASYQLAEGELERDAVEFRRISRVGPDEVERRGERVRLIDDGRRDGNPGLVRPLADAGRRVDDLVDDLATKSCTRRTTTKAMTTRQRSRREDGSAPRPRRSAITPTLAVG